MLAHTHTTLSHTLTHSLEVTQLTADLLDVAPRVRAALGDVAGVPILRAFHSPEHQFEWEAVAKLRMKNSIAVDRPDKNVFGIRDVGAVISSATQAGRLPPSISMTRW